MAEEKKKLFSISHSKLSCYRRCLQQYHWKYVDKHYPRSSIGQIRGTAGHAALADWHVNYNKTSAMQAAWDSWSGESLADSPAWLLLANALNRYFAWSEENDTFKVLAAEYKFDIHYENPPVRFTGYIDGIIEEKDGRRWLLENKFLKRVATKHLDMDIQATLYLLAAQLLGKEVEGVLYNIVRVGDAKIALTEPAVRKYLYRNAAGLKRVNREILYQAEQMLKYEKEGGHPYRNPTRDCSWDCSFFSTCLSMLDNGEESLEQLQSVCHIDKKKGE